MRRTKSLHNALQYEPKQDDEEKDKAGDSSTYDSKSDQEERATLQTHQQHQQYKNPPAKSTQESSMMDSVAIKDKHQDKGKCKNGNDDDDADDDDADDDDAEE
jgi:hypothetical protein